MPVKLLGGLIVTVSPAGAQVLDTAFGSPGPYTLPHLARLNLQQAWAGPGHGGAHRPEFIAGLRQATGGASGRIVGLRFWKVDIFSVLDLPLGVCGRQARYRCRRPPPTVTRMTPEFLSGTACSPAARMRGTSAAPPMIARDRWPVRLTGRARWNR
jgi:hypothetical protein